MYDWIGKLTQSEPAVKRLNRVFRLLPRPFVYGLGRLSGMALYRVCGQPLRRRIAANLTALLGPTSPRELAQLSRNYLTNLLLTLLEIVVEADSLPHTAGRRFQVEGEQHLGQALAAGRGAIVYTPHVGNFFYYYWYLTRRYSCLTVATAGSAELRPLYVRFQALGCPGLDYDDTPPLALYRALKRHLSDGGVVFLLGDFWRPSFPPVRWFGRDTRAPEGAAMLALELGTPVVPFYGQRLPGWRCSRHRLVFEPPLKLHEQFARHERRAANDLLHAFMEKVVRQTPAEWFYWFNAEERWEPAAGPDNEAAGSVLSPGDDQERVRRAWSVRLGSRFPRKAKNLH
ncbi:lysophospholipid acyltransferase family protein [Paenibacillus athensensis]|uniref:Lipid A biosynthesis acyltransferase n=1 Tax=Paenibacillus athensensis TaxID=1967502 RepID=A0A4Y8Q7Z1_9BACL|nr:lysophospholipid acyltransferase family protein [Paenibacillus athensensis]MCD1257449.1 lysophospholipid acyltransferase family protein [Paenibacillus athensensis]